MILFRGPSSELDLGPLYRANLFNDDVAPHKLVVWPLCKLNVDARTPRQTLLVQRDVSDVVSGHGPRLRDQAVALGIVGLG